MKGSVLVTSSSLLLAVSLRARLFLGSVRFCARREGADAEISRPPWARPAFCRSFFFFFWWRLFFTVVIYFFSPSPFSEERFSCFSACCYLALSFFLVLFFSRSFLFCCLRLVSSCGWDGDEWKEGVLSTAVVNRRLLLFGFDCVDFP